MVVFPEPVPPMMAVTSPGRAREGHVGDGWLFCSGIAKRDVLKFDVAASTSPVCLTCSASLISGSIASTSLIRVTDAAARGSTMNIIETMSIAKRICVAYCRKAINAPICMSPLLMRMLPNQRIATLVTFNQHHDWHQDCDDAVDPHCYVG